jgi:glycosyltransferase involved in cell wall biosynthesis
MVPERVTSPSRPNSDGICFFMPCTYEFPKGHHIALKAFRQFLDSGHDGSLIFAGDDNGGYRNEVQNLIKSLNLTDKVTLLEHQHDISSLYESCDVVLAPYLGPESFCLTVLEGIANGRHVIASSIDAISELYSDCPSVVLVKPNSSEDLSLAMMSPNVFDRSLKNLSGPEIVNFLSEFDSEFMFSKYDQVLGINL